MLSKAKPAREERRQGLMATVEQQAATVTREHQRDRRGNPCLRGSRRSPGLQGFGARSPGPKVGLRRASAEI